MTEDPEVSEAIRRTAYFFWEQDGRPDGRAAEYWQKAKEAHQRQIAFDRWLAEGSPVGRAAANWHDAERKIDPAGD
jgi:hypothetical protein